MRADNNWEDEIGKRLREHEESPPPFAWDKIKNDIKPRRRFRPLLWLPVLLALFVSLPLAYHYSGFLQSTNGSGQFRQPAAGQATTTGRTAPPATASSPAIQPQASPAAAGSPAHPQVATEAVAEQPEPASGNATGRARPKQVAIAVLPAERPGKKHPAKLKDLPEAYLAGGTPASGITKKKGTGSAERNRLQPVLSGKELPATEGRKHPGKNTDGHNYQTAETDQIMGRTAIFSQPGKDRANGTTTGTDSKTIAGSGTTTAAGTIINKATPEAESSVNNTQAIHTESGEAIENSLPAADSVAGKTMAENKLPATEAAAKAEEKAPEDKKAEKWSVSFYGTPQFAFQRVRADTEDDVMLVRVNDQTRLSADRLGYELGFRGNYQLTEKFGLEAGFQFADLKQNLNFTTAKPGADSVVINQGPNGQLTMEVYNREENHEYTSRHYLGGIYLGASYAVYNRVKVTGGAGTGWLIHSDSNQEELKPGKGKITPYLTGGVRYELLLQNEITLQVGPVVQYYLRPMQEKAAFYGGKPVTFGLFMGLKLKSGK